MQAAKLASSNIIIDLYIIQIYQLLYHNLHII